MVTSNIPKLPAGLSNFVQQEGASEIEEIFVSAMHQTWQHTVGMPDEKEVLMGFLLQLCDVELPQQLLTTEVLKKTTEEIFQSRILRNFVMKLTTLFQFRLTCAKPGADQYKQFIDNLAWSLDVRSVFPNKAFNASQHCAIPSDYAERFLSFENLSTVLLANKWIVTLFLLQQYHPAILKEEHRFLEEHRRTK